MSFLDRFRAPKDPLAQPSPQSTAQYLASLMEENNRLLRELIQGVTGHPAMTRSAGVTPNDARRIRTDKDVFRVTRDTVLDQERARLREADMAQRTPANGPDSARWEGTSSTVASAAQASDLPKATTPTRAPS